MRSSLSLLVSALLVVACATGDGGNDAGPPDAPLTLVAVTFNTGTSEGTLGDLTADENGGYGPDEASMSDLYYGDGLAFAAFVDATAAFLADVAPDIIGFQEIFSSDECPSIPETAWPGFVCETWQPGDPTVAQLLLGDGYQVACHQGKSDKCLAVKKSFARIRGCDDDLCLDFLDGVELDGCGNGSRLGRAVLDLEVGGELVAINVHGTSGMTTDDMECRRRLYTALFEGGDDGGPLADGERHVIVGDWNTDPGRLYQADPSADVIVAHVGTGKRFDFITDVGEQAVPTYLVLNIDHVVSDAFEGECTHPGTPGVPRVIEERFFDHKPAICSLTEKGE